MTKAGSEVEKRMAEVVRSLVGRTIGVVNRIDLIRGRPGAPDSRDAELRGVISDLRSKFAGLVSSFIPASAAWMKSGDARSGAPDILSALERLAEDCVAVRAARRDRHERQVIRIFATLRRLRADEESRRLAAVAHRGRALSNVVADLVAEVAEIRELESRRGARFGDATSASRSTRGDRGRTGESDYVDRLLAGWPEEASSQVERKSAESPTSGKSAAQPRSGAGNAAADVEFWPIDPTTAPALAQALELDARSSTRFGFLEAWGVLDDFVWTFQTGTSLAPQSISLGLASSYAVLAFNTVTNVNNPGTIVTGDLGISPGSALVGFPPGLITGAVHTGDATAAAAKGALLAAYNDAAGRLGAAVLPGNLSGLTFTPGVYKNSTSVILTAGNCTLDAQGDSNSVFIFQMGSTLTTMAGTRIILAGGAKANNIYWAVGTSATLGATSAFKGTILAASAITMQTGASIEGRLLAQGAAIALDTNAITVPSP